MSNPDEKTFAYVANRMILCGIIGLLMAVVLLFLPELFPYSYGWRRFLFVLMGVSGVTLIIESFRWRKFDSV